MKVSYTVAKVIPKTAMVTTPHKFHILIWVTIFKNVRVAVSMQFCSIQRKYNSNGMCCYRLQEEGNVFTGVCLFTRGRVSLVPCPFGGVRVSLDRVSGRGIWGVGYPKGVGNVGVGYPEVEYLWDRVSRRIGYLQAVYPMGRVPRG